MTCGLSAGGGAVCEAAVVEAGGGGGGTYRGGGGGGGGTNGFSFSMEDIGSGCIDWPPMVREVDFMSSVGNSGSTTGSGFPKAGFS